jgi:hypothetical protein
MRPVDCFASLAMTGRNWLIAIPALVAKVMAEIGHAGAGLEGVMMAYGGGGAVSLPRRSVW